jgi:deoxycytidine triphosphate deaminase
MIIGSEELLRRVKEEDLVKNLSNRELTNPEGPGFDLRVEEFYEIRGKGFLGIEKRETAKARKVLAYNENEKQSLVIKPKDYYLMTTIEEVKIGKDLFARIYPRSTLFRSGLLLLTGKVSPGYYGRLTFGITNLGPARFEIELGARIAYIVFYTLKGKANLSRGQWRGGRVVTEGREEQV